MREMSHVQSAAVAWGRQIRPSLAESDGAHQADARTARHAAAEDGVTLSYEAREALDLDAWRDDEDSSDFTHHPHADHETTDLPHIGGTAASPAVASSSGDTRRRNAVASAIQSGQPVSFTSAQGASFDLTVSAPQNNGDGFDTYTFAVNGQQVAVRVEAGVDPNKAIAGAVNYWSYYPEALRGDLHEMTFNAGPDPSYNPNDPSSFRAKAAGGNNMIVFYEGTKHLNKKNFDHEMGHVIGDATEDRQASPDEKAQEAAAGTEVDSYHEQWVPEGWADAIATDKRSVSSYGNRNATEDFAEFWKAFMAARGSNSEMKKLSKRYPERFRIAASVWLGWEYRNQAA